MGLSFDLMCPPWPPLLVDFPRSPSHLGFGRRVPPLPCCTREASTRMAVEATFGSLFVTAGAEYVDRRQPAAAAPRRRHHATATVQVGDVDAAVHS